MVQRADQRDLRHVAAPDQDQRFPAPVRRHPQRLLAGGPRLAEEVEGIEQVAGSEARLLGKALGRQVIGVTPLRNLLDLDQPLVDAALEIGVDQRTDVPTSELQSLIRNSYAVC